MNYLKILNVFFIKMFITTTHTKTTPHNLIAIQDPHIIADLVYTTPNNFTGQQLYPDCAQIYLHKKAAARLIASAQEFAQHNVRIKVWDAYRPWSMQKKMWDIVPDEQYVANPKDGGFHTRGNSVDITLVDVHGNELMMATPFDCFDERAHMESIDLLPENIRNNVLLLKTIMERHGFTQYMYEWWHFTLYPLEKYPVLDISFEALQK